MFSLSADAIKSRRDQFFSCTRAALKDVIGADGVGNLPQFNAPWREPVWVLPAFYRGEAEDIALANRMVARYHDPFPPTVKAAPGVTSGKRFNIFQSTAFAALYAEFSHLLTPGASEVMIWQAEQCFKTYEGAGQSDLKFHGCNDNMPMMATKALILGGQALKNRSAYEQGVWNLNEFRRLLSRGAWASEFNSSTYSPITLCGLAKIAALAKDPKVSRMAADCELRLWAELLLHYHPATMHAGGPQCRSYAIDAAGHNHTLQMLFWLVFGPEVTGRDLVGSYFKPDGTEVVHFQGCYLQSVAEYCDILDNHFHLTDEVASLIERRSYPALTRGRAESMTRYDGGAGEYNTCSYMEENFSLGTVDTPLCGGDQTMQLYATYKRKPEVKTFRDASVIFYRYTLDRTPATVIEPSADGKFSNEKYLPSKGWAYAIQKTNSAMLLTIPHLQVAADQPVELLKLDVVFPAHYGKITRSVIGKNPVQEGAVGSSCEVVPVSIEVGDVFVHVQPLIPTSFERKNALQFVREGNYETLQLINYEGAARAFTRAELALMQNGFAFTIDSRHKYPSLSEFHDKMSNSLVLDYSIANHRFVRFKRTDVQFEVCYTPSPFGVQTRAVDGRHVPQPLFETNQLDVMTLPFMTGEVEEDVPLFPWGDSMAMHNYQDGKWLIGSRGIPQEEPYSRRNGNLS